MRSYFISAIFCLSIGCKKPVSSPRNSSAVSTHPEYSSRPATTPSLEWFPKTKGLPFQLGLHGGNFLFCDEGGAHSLDLATGTQSAATQRCDQNKEEVQSGCDDSVQIHGDPDTPNDDISIQNNDFLLNGHIAACDRQGQLLIVATHGAVEVIDGSANKFAVVEPGGGDQAVIGSGWVAWRTMDDRRPLRLETVTKAMEHAETPK